MKKKILSILLLVFLFVPLALTGCDFFVDIDEEGYELVSTVGQLNVKVQGTMYGLWESKKTAEGYERYKSARGSYVYEYGEYFLVKALDGQSFNVWKNKDYIATYTEDGHVVRLGKDGSRGFVDSSITSQPTKISVYPDENGYLFITDSNYMIYFIKDVSRFYINENNTAFFAYGYERFEVPSSEALSSALNSLGSYRKFYLPSPGINIDTLLIKDYVVSGKTIGVKVFFGDILPLDYIAILRNNNYEVALNEYYGLFAPNYEGNDNVWLATDKNSEFIFTINLGWLLSYGNGTEITIYQNNLKVQNGTAVTENTDWTETEKQNMSETYGGIVPFTTLGANYNVGLSLKNNGDSPSYSNLGSMCYEISDGYYRYLLANYGQSLEENGFHLYQAPVDFESEYEDLFNWWFSEESKYYNCYINEASDIAIRFRYDRIKGNLIQVFKYSQMTTAGYFN